MGESEWGRLSGRVSGGKSEQEGESGWGRVSDWERVGGGE